MKKKSGLFTGLFIALASTLFISCDKDFNSLGADLINEDYMDVNKYTTTDGITAGYFKTGAVATNGLLINNLGVFDNPLLGTSEYHYVTQLSLEENSPDFGQNTVIDSVFLYVPYFSNLETTQSDGQKIYTLDSIKGTGTFDLKVYESNYYMSSIDPNTVDGVKRYYSNDKPNFDNNKGALLNTSLNVAQNSKFSFSNKEIALFKRNDLGELLDKDNNVIPESSTFDKKVVLESFAPGMWLDLDKSFFQNKIINAATANLSSSSVFSNYFRGIYFNVTKDASSRGTLASLDFSKGYIQINYTFENENGDKFKNTFKLNLVGENASLIENNYSNLPQTSTDKLLVVGGGKGSNSNSTDGFITYIDLFGADAGNGIPYQIDYLANQNWLINEANVTIFVDRATVANHTDYEPQRLFLYDINNNSVLIDYINDTSSNNFNPLFSKAIYSGVLVKKDEKGFYYKFRITEYLKSLIKNQTPMSDSSNRYRLGLSVTEAVTLSSFSPLFNNLNSLSVSQIPTGSVMSSLGTVLHGPQASDVENRIKFEVYYTNPN